MERPLYHKLTNIEALKHPRYTRLLGRDRKVTIAAGFVHTDGFLLCSDSDFTSAAMKHPGIKLGHFTGPWGAIAGVFAGHVSFAAGAFDSLRRHLNKVADGKVELVDLVERHLEVYYKRHVYKHPDRQTGNFEYQFILSLTDQHFKKQGLYSTNCTVMQPVKSFACVGVGADMGNAFLGSIYAANFNRNAALVTAAYMLSHVKQTVLYCGGESNFLCVDHDGKIPISGQSDLARYIEKVSPSFEFIGKSLFMHHILLDEDAYAKSVDQFMKDVKTMREDYLKIFPMSAKPNCDY